MVAVAALTALAVLVAPLAAQAGEYQWTAPDTASFNDGVNGFRWSGTPGIRVSTNNGLECDLPEANTFMRVDYYCGIAYSGKPAGVDVVRLGGSFSMFSWGAITAFDNDGIKLQATDCGGNLINPIYASHPAGTERMGVSSNGATSCGIAGRLTGKGKNPAATNQNYIGASNFNARNVSLTLADANKPAIATVEGAAITGMAGAGGWNGVGCFPMRYGWWDGVGSGIRKMTLRRTTAPTLNVDLPDYGVVAPVNPTLQNRDTCISGAVTGLNSFTTTGEDRAGENASYVFGAYFDLTKPVIGAPQVLGTELVAGRDIGSAAEYRPEISIPVSDAHSGLKTVTATMDGNALAVSLANGNATVRPAARLSLGSHMIAFTVTDKVNNVETFTRNFDIVDDAAPVITVASPTALGDNVPTLDVTATDDYSGLNTTTWSTTVNGVAVPMSSNTSRLQASLGRVVDGTHFIDVTIKDIAGNTRTHSITYEANGDDTVPQLSGAQLTGINLYSGAPETVNQGETHRFKAVMAKAGRPVEGRAEIRKGATTQAGKDIEINGAVDMALVINEAGPLQLHGPSGSGLTPADITYTFVPTPPVTPTCETDPSTCDAGEKVELCKRRPELAICATVTPPPTGGGAGTGGTGGTGTGGTNGTNGANGDAGAPGSANSAANTYCIVNNAAGCKPGYPTDLVYYVTVGGKDIPYWNGVPLAESGASLDRVAPAWKLQLIQSKKGVVRKTGKVKFRIWANELAVFQVTPVGAPRRSTIGTRNQWRTIVLDFGPKTKLGKQLRKAKAGSKVTVKLALAASDKNKNQSKLTTVTFKVIV